jgi:hypothetical protein
VVESAELLIKEGKHPASYVTYMVGPDAEARESGHMWLREICVQWLVDHNSPVEMAKLETMCFPEKSTDTAIKIPLDAFCWDVPPTGYPPIIDWMCHLTSILGECYDGRREPIDIKPVATMNLGDQLKPNSIALVKGFTRTSIVVFSVFSALREMSFSMSEEDTASFTRPPRTLISCL